MIYIFLTYSLYGVAGAPSYVNYKVKWLNERGVNTVVFDHYGGLYMRKQIELDYLLPYKDNRLLELFFPPSYFTQHQRDKILEKLLSKIGNAEDYVVESNSTRLALWGELLAIKLHAKHLVLCVGEHLDIRSKQEFLFMDFKLKRHELFAIKPKTIQNMFRGYKYISDSEAQNCYFSASMGVKLEDVTMAELDNLPEAEFKILSFGRKKMYFDNMINGVVKFAQNHIHDRVNFLFMGDVELSKTTMNHLETVSNLFVMFIPSKRPVPQAVFDYTDVVIATAGCANLSYKAGKVTISMDVETCKPLGVMGYNTTDSVYSTNKNQPNYEVCDLLEDILVNHLYNGPQLMKKNPSGKGFKFQMGMINNDRIYWPNIEKIFFDKLLRRMVEKIVLRCGGIRIFAKR